jgi:hypothetical protein
MDAPPVKQWCLSQCTCISLNKQIRFVCFGELSCVYYCVLYQCTCASIKGSLYFQVFPQRIANIEYILSIISFSFSDHIPSIQTAGIKKIIRILLQYFIIALIS